MEISDRDLPIHLKINLLMEEDSEKQGRLSISLSLLTYYGNSNIPYHLYIYKYQNPLYILNAVFLQG
jgi:hypothetical protein